MLTIPGYEKSRVVERPLPRLDEIFGVRSLEQLMLDGGELVRHGFKGARFQFGTSSTGLLRADLAIPAYAGLAPADGLAPIFNLFDRTAGGLRYSQRVTRRHARDFRGGRLSYDEHVGTDFVLPPGTRIVAAAPGRVVAIRDRWLRGGLTIAVDHGHGVITQYTHCSKAMARIGDLVARGDLVALSGAAGFDVAQFFPLVPPHVHFTVFVGGRPVDPFLAEGEEERAGTWHVRNSPGPSGPWGDDPRDPPRSRVDGERLERVAAACADPRVRREIEEHRSEPETLAAILEDALFFDEWAWPFELRGSPLRPDQTPADLHAASEVKLSLPLPSEQYCGTSFADAWFTAAPRE